MIAALYVDSRRGPYPHIEGVDCWDEARDATLYDGPYPVVCHPPCGHYGRYHQRCKDDGHTGPIAVAQVRKFGGVLKQPRHSKLWTLCSIPKPGAAPDEFGGYSIDIEQGDWGHRAQKGTWLYVVGCHPGNLPLIPPRRPPPVMPASAGKTRGILELMSKTSRHLTPPAFAEWLVDVARRCHVAPYVNVSYVRPTSQEPK